LLETALCSPLPGFKTPPLPTFLFPGSKRLLPYPVFPYSMQQTPASLPFRFSFQRPRFGTLHIPVKGLSYTAEFLCGVGRALFFSALSPRRNALLHFYVFSLSLTVCRIPSVFLYSSALFSPA
jgi:hypothetical protein